MAHVLIVTLGPIQDFIAAARRTRDLWFGSWLLSELSPAAVAERGRMGMQRRLGWLRDQERRGRPALRR